MASARSTGPDAIRTRKSAIPSDRVRTESADR